VLTNLLNHVPYLHYHEYLAAGLPIATGVIEGACRHLVSDRMDLTGARWSLAGAEAVLRLRALRSSGDFDEYWHFHTPLEIAQEERETARLCSVFSSSVTVLKKKRPWPVRIVYVCPQLDIF
jgi:hypothetical protein